MAKEYTCEACGETFVGDRESVLVEEVQKHAEEEHDMDMDGDDVRADIEDT